jgi:hypothetical protein
MLGKAGIIPRATKMVALHPLLGSPYNIYYTVPQLINIKMVGGGLAKRVLYRYCAL